MNPENTTVTVTIDNESVQAKRGSTILQVAREHEIYIPTLCYHESLSPHGGCRMCIVEVEGVRTFPTACTTPVDEGMVIRTQTSAIREMRMDILQLFLSEHTSSCLICDERVECRESMATIRKAGVTTGCRYCPKDSQCELQAVSEYLGVNDIQYPIYYRGVRVETEDPFYDRDYNLCILCGRCVRVCQEVRTANVLAYKHRGRNTIIGPAFSRTHLEGGCEFCGACVAVCPTGSLREKAREWEGKPEREEVTTCTFCGVGCQLKLLVKGDRVIGSLPANDPLVNQGQLCVKGRFCNTELVNGYQRLRTAYERFGNINTEISWERALEVAAGKLASCPPDGFGMLISPNCTTEDLYVAQKFVRTVMKSNNIDTSARIFYGAGFNAYVNLFRKSVPLSDVRTASTILAIGLDTRFGRSVVGVAMRQAMKHGAKIISVNPREHNFSLLSDVWLQPQVGQEIDALKELLHVLSPTGTAARSGPPHPFSDGLEKARALLSASKKTVILVGSEFLQYQTCRDILELIAQLAEAANAGIMPLPAQNNLVGSLLAGAYAELSPGAHKAPGIAKWNAWSLWSGVRTEVLYLVGELPPTPRPPADFLIFQNIYPAEPYCTADLTFPSAASTEVNGTFINGEGRIQPVRKAVSPPVHGQPDWKIFCMLAKRMGASGFDYADENDIRAEMKQCIKEYEAYDERVRTPNTYGGSGTLSSDGHMPSPVPGSQRNGRYTLTVSVVEHTHRGYPLAAWVEGSKALLTEGMLEINPEDAEEAGISHGDLVAVAIDGSEYAWPAKLLRNQPKGTLHASLRECASIRPNPITVEIRRAHV